MARPNKRTTLREVAEATGLSTAAVSYALRGKHVSKETEERVRKAAAELGYEADPIARALASGRTSMVGVLAGDLQDLWQQQLMAAIGRELLAGDRYALILDAGGDPARELALAKQLRDQRVDGLLVSPVDPSAEGWAQIADAVPVVSIGDALSRARTAGEVLFDNRAGIDAVLDYLRGLGHRRVTVLTPTGPSTPDRPADVYVREAADRLGIGVEVLPCAQELGEATAVARRVLTGAGHAGEHRPHGRLLLLRLHRLRRLRRGRRGVPGRRPGPLRRRLRRPPRLPCPHPAADHPRLGAGRHRQGGRPAGGRGHRGPPRPPQAHPVRPPALRAGIGGPAPG